MHSGPLVGHKLKQLYEKTHKIEVYGSLGKNVSAINAKSTLEYIKNRYKFPLIIAIDSAISKQENIGNIVVDNRSIYLGRALNKKLIFAGDISIKGIVSRNVNIERYNYYLLQNTSLDLVMNLADVVSNGIFSVINV